MAFSTGNETTVADNASFTDILHTPALRVELVAIIALTTDRMRRDLLSTFSPQPDASNHPHPDPHVTGGSLIDAGMAHEARSTKVWAQADLDSPRTQGLRRAALTWFDKRQIDVLRRVGEVLSVRPEAIRKARAEAKAQVQRVGDERKRRAFVAWAEGKGDHRDETDGEGNEGILPEGFDSAIVQMEKGKRVLVSRCVLLLLLSLEHYPAHSRTLMLHLTHILDLPSSTLAQHESEIASTLLATAAAQMSADESTARQASSSAAGRRWKIGAATVAGAALIGITGGLAAPILAAGVGGIMGGLGLGAVATLLGPLATNAVLVGGLFGAYGGRMTGGIMEKYAREVRDFRFLPVVEGQKALGDARVGTEESEKVVLRDEEARGKRKLRVLIGTSGSVTDADGFLQPWNVFDDSRIESFGLRWEMDALLQLGRKISEILRSYAWDFAKFQLLGMILSGLWPFGLLRAASSLDSPFAIAKTRSDKAGKVLADALANRVQGERPVTLVGFGLGARVIYSCLLQLADINAFGLVEGVVLMGAPTPSDASSWRRIRAMVSGRVVNVFSADDFMLGFLYRASSAQMGIAGVQEVEGVAGVENFDLTDLVKSHNCYSQMVGTILQRVGFEDLDGEAVKHQQQRQQQESGSSGKDADQLIDDLAGFEMQDNSLAREDELGNIVKVENEKGSAIAQGAMKERQMPPAFHHRMDEVPDESRDVEEKEEEEHRPICMLDNDDPLTVVEPSPEPDYGPDRETVRFGSGGRGFDVKWDVRSA